MHKLVLSYLHEITCRKRDFVVKTSVGIESFSVIVKIDKKLCKTYLVAVFHHINCNIW